MTDRIIHCVIKPSGALEEFFCTFIYAHNDAKLRDSLWETLSKLNSKLRGPWLMMGDFNCVINIEERIGSAVRQKVMDPMRRCISECELQDIPYSGHFYTWSNKQVTEDRVWSKLDRVMANEKWLEAFQSANAVFLTEGCSDHCPALLRMNFEVGKGRKPFKYFQMWQQAPDYSQRIQQAWEGEIRGTAMFKVIQKLKRVKTSLKELNQKGFNNLQAEDTKTYQELVEIQEALHKDPLNTDLMQKEKDVVYNYNQAHKNYMQFLRQKAKASWIRKEMTIQPFFIVVSGRGHAK
ncbi:LINE-1 retrotransposable element ORF2 protein [Bienertia sinuspersici]